MDIFQQLARPFPVNRIHWRIGATSGDKTTGIGLAYIDARDVMQRLDDVMTPGGWQAEYLPPTNGIVICRIGLLCENTQHSAAPLEWVWKANGAGETQVEGEKGGCSDAFKRAAVLWGIGRYLYALPNNWVPIKKRGNSYFLPDESTALLTGRLPHWATPEGYDAIMEKRKAA